MSKAKGKRLKPVEGNKKVESKLVIQPEANFEKIKTGFYSPFNDSFDCLLDMPFWERVKLMPSVLMQKYSSSPKIVPTDLSKNLSVFFSKESSTCSIFSPVSLKHSIYELDSINKESPEKYLKLSACYDKSDISSEFPVHSKNVIESKIKRSLCFDFSDSDCSFLEILQSKKNRSASINQKAKALFEDELINGFTCSPIKSVTNLSPLANVSLEDSFLELLQNQKMRADSMASYHEANFLDKGLTNKFPCSPMERVANLNSYNMQIIMSPLAKASCEDSFLEILQNQKSRPDAIASYEDANARLESEYICKSVESVKSAVAGPLAILSPDNSFIDILENQKNMSSPVVSHQKANVLYKKEILNECICSPIVSIKKMDSENVQIVESPLAKVIPYDDSFSETLQNRKNRSSCINSHQKINVLQNELGNTVESVKSSNSKAATIVISPLTKISRSSPCLIYSVNQSPFLNKTEMCLSPLFSELYTSSSPLLKKGMLSKNSCLNTPRVLNRLSNLVFSPLIFDSSTDASIS